MYLGRLVISYTLYSHADLFGISASINCMVLDLLHVIYKELAESIFRSTTMQVKEASLQKSILDLFGSGVCL